MRESGQSSNVCAHASACPARRRQRLVANVQTRVAVCRKGEQGSHPLGPGQPQGLICGVTRLQARAGRKCAVLDCISRNKGEVREDGSALRGL